MIIIIHSHTNYDTLETNLGNPEYSYYFVLRAFKPVLEKLGNVVTVTAPEHHVDAIYEFCKRVGEKCIFLSFAPPHRTPLDLKCPTIPVFAWEFDKIPSETWNQDLRNDWTVVLQRLNAAITHSDYALGTLIQAMGKNFPAISLPAPVWDHFSTKLPGTEAVKSFSLSLPGEYSDSWSNKLTQRVDVQTQVTEPEKITATFEVEFDVADQSTELQFTFIDAPLGKPYREIEISGVVYSAVLNPNDARKNWQDMLVAFCDAFKDVDDAILVLKFVSHHSAHFRQLVAKLLNEHNSTCCRVIVIYDFLSVENYTRLSSNSTYTLNASFCEGQCLPLMEYMSQGIPAVSAQHSAMRDYIHEGNAFIFSSIAEPTFWPQDPRQKITTQWYRFEDSSFKDKLLESYQIAKSEQEHYRIMSDNAKQTLKQHCSRSVIEYKLRDYIDKVLSQYPEVAP